MIKLNNIKSIERYIAYITAHVQPLVAIDAFSSTTTPFVLHTTKSPNVTNVLLKRESAVHNSVFVSQDARLAGCFLLERAELRSIEPRA